MIAELQGRAGDLETEVRVSRQQAQEGQEKLLHMRKISLLVMKSKRKIMQRSLKNKM